MLQKWKNVEINKRKAYVGHISGGGIYMSIRDNFKCLDTLKNAGEMILLCGLKTHHQLFLCTINTYDFISSRIERYEATSEGARKVIGKVYSRQARRGTQVIIHDYEALIELLQAEEGLSVPEDIKLSYIDLYHFNYKDKTYTLSSIKDLEQNAFKYFDLYAKLNSMYYVDVYCIFEYIISILEENYIDLKAINRQTQRINQNIEAAQLKTPEMLSNVNPLVLNQNNLIVLFEGEYSQTEMITDYTIKLMRIVDNKLEDVENIITYSTSRSIKEKCLYFVKEFYPLCRYIQGKYNLDQMIIIGSDAEEFIKIIYNVADMLPIMDLRHFVFKDFTSEEWRNRWSELTGTQHLKTFDVDEIKEALSISDSSIGIDKEKHRSLYYVSLQALLLRLLVLHGIDKNKYTECLKELAKSTI